MASSLKAFWFALFLLSVSYECAGQYEGYNNNEGQDQYEENQEQIQKNKQGLNRAGDRLVEFGNRYYTGLGLELGGFLLTVLGTVGQNPTMATGGTLISLGGVVYTILSFKKIKEAGEILRRTKNDLKPKNKHYLAVGATNHGIGFSYHF